MSFASDTKNELAHFMPEKKCCELAEIAGFIRMCGSIRIGGGRMKLALMTENPAVARHYKKLMRDYFDVDASLEIGQGSTLKKGKQYILTLDDSLGQKAEIILRETGILMLRGGMNYISDGIYDGLIRTKCCRKAYLRGAFLGAGTISDPEKSYHLEFVCSTSVLAGDMKKLIGSFVGLTAKTSVRNKSHVVYIKEAEQIADMLNIMKAHQQFFAFEDVRMTKEFRNRTNRINNCDSANTDKIVNASQRQLAAIKKIEEQKGLGFLPEKLREAARLRLENPAAGLEELAGMMEPPLTKSGMNNRFRKIEETAARL